MPRGIRKTKDDDSTIAVAATEPGTESEEIGTEAGEAAGEGETQVPVAKNYSGVDVDVKIPPVVYPEHDVMIPAIGLTTKQIFKSFSQPFDPDLLYYKPQVVSKDKTKCQIAVYADPRAYIDRLNEAVGPENWGTTFETIVIPFSGEKGWGENRKIVAGHKVIVYCHLSITGMGTHTEVGEAQTDNENVATSAVGQAFKRACVTFGIGRYLYDFSKGQWADYDDKKKKVVNPPPLPSFAYPVYMCNDCQSEIGWSKRRVGEDVEDVSPKEVCALTKGLYGLQVCGKCAKVRREATTTEGASARLQ